MDSILVPYFCIIVLVILRLNEGVSFGGKGWHYFGSYHGEGWSFFSSFPWFPLSFTSRGVGISVYSVLLLCTGVLIFSPFICFEARRFFFGVWPVEFIFCDLLLFIVVLGTFDLVGSGYLGT